MELLTSSDLHIVSRSLKI